MIETLILAMLLGMVAIAFAVFMSRSRRAPGPVPKVFRASDRELLEEIRRRMEEDAPWREPDFDLAALAEVVGAGRGRVSRVINGLADRNFHQFVNDYRVEAAKSLILDLENPRNDVDEIARAVGYRSRSAFYEAFEDRVRQTPGEYRRQRQPSLPGFDE